MADESSPIYGPFFGVMGSAAAMVFSGKCLERSISLIDRFLLYLFFILN